ncbi:MAG: TolC family protein [Longimicrobiales bacterium]
MNSRIKQRRALATCELVALIGFGPLAAQEQLTQPLTFEDALRIAESTNEEIAIAEAAVRRASGEQQRARSAYLPQIDLTASYVRTLASQFDIGFNGGDSAVAGLPFGREHAWSVGLSIAETVLSAGRAAQSRIAEAGRVTEEIALQSARAQLALDVTAAYFDAVLTDRLVANAQSALGQAESTLELVRVGHEVGNQAEFEVLRARVSVGNQRPVMIQRAADRVVAYARLKQLLDLPIDEPLVLAEELAEGDPSRVAQIAAAMLGLEVDTVVTLTRAPVRQAIEAAQIQEDRVRVAKSERVPTVTVNMDYGRFAYPQSGVPFTAEFLTDWTIGATLSVPLYTGGRITGDVRVARAGRDAAIANLALARELAALDTRDALERLKAAQASYGATAGTVEEAEKTYEIAQVRFEEGISTQLELNDSRLALEISRGNRARAERDLHVARVRVALLPFLPVPSTPGGAPTEGTGLPAEEPESEAGMPEPAATSGFGTTAATRAGALR